MLNSGTLLRNASKAIALANKQPAELCLADAKCVLQHGPENRLQLARKRADDAQYVRCCLLLMARSRKFAAKPRDLAFLPGGR